jgi:hypothetical protein
MWTQGVDRLPCGGLVAFGQANGFYLLDDADALRASDRAASLFGRALVDSKAAYSPVLDYRGLEVRELFAIVIKEPFCKHGREGDLVD